MSDADEPDASEETKPAPKPRSAASRARRIGGGVAPRPSARTETGSASGSDEVSLAKPSGRRTSTTTRGARRDEKPDADKRDTKPTGTTATGGKPTGTKATSTKATGTKATATKDRQKPAGRQIALPGWSTYVPAAALAAAAVVFLVLFGVRFLGGDDEPDTTSSRVRQEVLAAAKTCVAAINTYDYKNLAAARATAPRCTSGQLTKDYVDLVNNRLAKNAGRLKASQTARIETAGIECVSKNGEQWSILLYGEVSIATANYPNGRVDPLAEIASLRKVDGKWRIDRLRLVSQLSQANSTIC